MRSARMALTTAAASAVLVLGAPGAYAAVWGDGDHDDASYSKEHDNGGKYEKPSGGMHTGGGALTAVGKGDWEGGSKEGEESHKQDEGNYGEGKQDEGKHEEGKQDEGNYGEGKQDEGKHEEGKQDEGKHEEGKQDEGKHDEGKQDEGEKSWGGGEYEKPRGGMHTGGGALTAVDKGDWEGGSKEGEESHKQDEGKHDEGEKSWGGGEHEKPRGGMHTGGGGLDAPTTTAGGLAVLGVAATGLYAVRRRKSAHGVA
ncbi:hypothetical protein [Streptomyces sp. NPDC017890]|uniref:hypothetical protein n=1 Tax=Streptomyces sp. NPDC017890 TaxID=3365015 RepID=UPI003787BC81